MYGCDVCIYICLNDFNNFNNYISELDLKNSKLIDILRLNLFIASYLKLVKVRVSLDFIESLSNVLVAREGTQPGYLS